MRTQQVPLPATIGTILEVRTQQVPLPVTPAIGHKAGHVIEVVRQPNPKDGMACLPSRRMSCRGKVCCYVVTFFLSLIAVSLIMTYINTGGFNVFGIREKKPLSECPNSDGTVVIESYEQPCLCGKETCEKKANQKRAKSTRCYASVSLCTISYYGHPCGPGNRERKTDCMCNGKLCINGGYCNNGICNMG